MLISVVIPTHNVSRWVGETLASAMAQSRASDEIIVVDDASTDDTRRRVREAGARLLEVSVHNAAAARNAGAWVASGEFIAFLDGDDRWRPNHLQRFAAGMGEMDVAYFAHHDGFDDATGIFEGRRPLRSDAANGLSDRILIDYFLGQNHGWPTSGMIVRRDRFLAVGGFDETQRRRHDAEMFLRAVRGHTWAYQPEVTWEYRLSRPGNISGDNVECAAYYLRALHKIRTLYREQRLNPMIARQSRKTLSYGLKSGRLEADKDTIELALRSMRLPHRAFYSGAIRAPRLAASILRLKAKLRKTGQASVISSDGSRREGAP